MLKTITRLTLLLLLTLPAFAQQKAANRKPVAKVTVKGADEFMRRFKKASPQQIKTASFSDLSGNRAQAAAGTAMPESMRHAVKAANTTKRAVPGSRANRTAAYCDGSFLSTADCAGADPFWISNVAITGTTLNNASACTSGTGQSYTAYDTTVATQTGTLLLDNFYTLQVTQQTSTIYVFYAYVWIDWDGSQTFDDNEFHAWPLEPTGTTNTYSFRVPRTTPLGNIGMRVRVSGFSATSSDACTALDYGEGEDYTIKIADNPAVRVIDFNPVYGAAGTGVDIYGLNLGAASQVLFNGTPALGFTVTNSTTLHATVPAGATSGLITVITPTDTVISRTSFFVRSTATVLNGDSVVTCDGLLLDHDGGGNYADGLSAFEEIIPDSPGKLVKLTWQTFSIEADSDLVGIFDGDINGPLVAVYTGNSLPAPITASNPDGKLTVVFLTNAAINDLGFSATITCADLVAPVLSKLYPRQARVGFPINIYATNGGAFASVTIDDIPVDSLRYNAVDGYYQCEVPAGVSGGLVKVTNAAGSGSAILNILSGDYCLGSNISCSAGSSTNAITNVSISQSGNTLFSNTTDCNQDLLFNDVGFPDTAGYTATLVSGTTYSLSVTTNTSCITSVWIDYNHDGAFDTGEWKQVSTASTANTPTRVNITIPASATLGKTVMRIRSRSANNPNDGTSACTQFFSGEGEDYIVNLAPACAAAVPTITASGPLSICAPGSVTLTSSQASGNIWSTGDTTQSITVTAAGSYNVMHYAGCTSIASTPKVVTVSYTPAIPVITAPSHVACSGSGLVLTASDDSAGTTYLGSTGGTRRTLPVTTSGRYTVKAIKGACTTATSDTFVVTVATTPSRPTVTVTGPLAFCAGSDSVTLTSSATTGNLWSTGDTTQSIVVKASGTYNVKTIVGACTSTASTNRVVTVSTMPNLPVITAPSHTACSGTPLVLTATGNATSYKWSTGATGATLSVTATGKYAVKGISGTCTTATSDTFVVTVAPTPARPTVTVTGNVAFCAGDSVVLTSSAATGNLWSTNDTTQSIKVRASGSYTVKVISGVCTSTASAAKVVTVSTLPAVPTVTAAGPVTFCQGGNVLLSAPAGAGYTYKWSPGNQTTRSITVTATGSYTVQTINGTCTTAASAPAVVTVNPVPSAPVITPAPDSLHATPGGTSYIWSRGTTVITGQTGPAIPVSGNGSYTVKIVVNGCTSVASAPSVVTAINSYKAAEVLTLVPNPAAGEVRISGLESASAVEITDALGRLVHLQIVDSATPLNLGSLSPGVYNVTVNNRRLRLIKN